MSAPQTEPCLKCPRMLKQQRTPEGKKFCIYCELRRRILAAHKDQTRFFDSYIFEDDFRMGLINRLQTWSAAPFHCPKCKSTEFTVDVETKETPRDYEKQGIFMPAPLQRVVFICKSGHRFYIDENMATHTLGETVD